MLFLDVTPRRSIYRECLIWFAEEPFRPSGYETVVFKEARLEVTKDQFSPKPVDTLWSDLHLSEDDLWARLSSGKRRDVAIGRNRGWSFSFGNKSADIRHFHAAHSVFVLSKKLGPFLSVPVLERNAEHFLAAFVRDSSEKTICWNFYVLDKPIARLLYSGSDLSYHKPDRGYAATVLHWNMMLHFKKEGYGTYDWGGISLDPALPHLAGITKFKAEFGGSLEKRFDYSCSFPISRWKLHWRRSVRALARRIDSNLERIRGAGRRAHGEELSP